MITCDITHSEDSSSNKPVSDYVDHERSQSDDLQLFDATSGDETPRPGTWDVMPRQAVPEYSCENTVKLKTSASWMTLNVVVDDETGEQQKESVSLNGAHFKA